MFLVNSRNPQFTAAAIRSRSKSFHASRHPFSRSYGASLPSSLTRVLSRALEYSSRPPESVCGTDHEALPSRLFLEAWDHWVFETEVSTSSPLGINERAFVAVASYALCLRA